MKRTFPEVFESVGVRSVDTYPAELLTVLRHIAPEASRIRRLCC